MALLNHSLEIVKGTIKPWLYCVIAATLSVCSVHKAYATAADEAVVLGDEFFNKAVGLSKSGDHVESAHYFVKARSVYGRFLRYRSRFRECNKLLVAELKAQADIARSRGDVNLARKVEETSTKILMSDMRAFSDDKNWREKPIDLYLAAYNKLSENKPGQNNEKNFRRGDAAGNGIDSGRTSTPKLRKEFKPQVGEVNKGRGNLRDAGIVDIQQRMTSARSKSNDLLLTIIIVLVGVILPVVLLVRLKRKNGPMQQTPLASPAKNTSAKKVYSFEEQSVRDFVERCRVGGMPCSTTSDFRLSGGEHVYGMMSPASLLETISATNLSMRHVSTGALYATNRRFVYVVGGDVRVIPYNDVVKFESTNLFGNEGFVSVALSSRRKRMEFHGPNSFMISMAFGYVTDPDIRNILQALSIAGPEDPAVESLIQKLLSCQSHLTDESSDFSAGCLGLLFSLAMGAAVLFGIYKVICWMINTAKVN